ncbi:hypothetical protein B0H16DRAFT_1474535 [Mycena metata]|uniref:Uncharacterized protein n=1 Tax=Mycena metata TaxID=1033252 RepID=A0AAD7MJH2_9AGAR|nr:hypothetical protein B0H16DRAFT_1474535 [Mycena metata]
MNAPRPCFILLYISPVAGGLRSRLSGGSKGLNSHARCWTFVVKGDTPWSQYYGRGIQLGHLRVKHGQIYLDGFVKANPLLFIDNEWIDATQLRVFLQNSATPGPRAETPPPAIKIESKPLPPPRGTGNTLRLPQVRGGITQGD